MYDVNVLGLLQVTQALLPALRASGDGRDRQRRLDRRPDRLRGRRAATPRPSTAPRWSPRRSGSSWSASRSGSARSRPGWCAPTSSRWSASTATRSAPTAVYAGVPDPLVAEDVADAIAWIATRPVARQHRRAGDQAARPGRRSTRCTGSDPVGPGDGPHGERHRLQPMQTIGLVGGMSWESSEVYYRDLNLGVAGPARRTLLAQAGAEHRRLRRGDGARGRGALAADRRAARRGGPRRRARRRRLPAAVHHDVPQGRRPGRGGGRHPAAPPRPTWWPRRCARQGVTTVGFIGTTVAMSDGFFTDRLARHGLETVVPRRAAPRHAQHARSTTSSCTAGSSTRPGAGCSAVIEELWDAGAGGVLLGCTELELLITQADCELPVFPCTTLHVTAALDRALAGLTLSVGGDQQQVGQRALVVAEVLLRHGHRPVADLEGVAEGVGEGLGRRSGVAQVEPVDEVAQPRRPAGRRRTGRPSPRGCARRSRRSGVRGRRVVAGAGSRRPGGCGRAGRIDPDGRPRLA